MNVAELIDKAKQATNSLGVVAEKLGKSQSRISEWKKGVGKPSATDIMLMAEMAGLPPLETLAEVESQLDADRASVWQRALTSLRAASVTGALALLVWTGLGMAPDHAHASIPPYPDSSLPSHGRGHWFDPSTAHQRIQGPASHDAGPFRFSRARLRSGRPPAIDAALLSARRPQREHRVDSLPFVGGRLDDGDRILASRLPEMRPPVSRPAIQVAHAQCDRATQLRMPAADRFLEDERPDAGGVDGKHVDVVSPVLRAGRDVFHANCDHRFLKWGAAGRFDAACIVGTSRRHANIRCTRCHISPTRNAGSFCNVMQTLLRVAQDR
ncbi:helix-turn-helix domain-containing protein [Burkholderia ubonensis]|uniref:helix-turn-helix domain-containing protein n=1 Tax=Burkholderia ubonensis TaxID=101571 RepID=UPI001E3ED2E9|nr:helix-turn-helix transcriptional regulator [Burkholderia ubonensis]